MRLVAAISSVAVAVTGELHLLDMKKEPVASPVE